MSNLMLHAGGKRVPFEALAAVDTPVAVAESHTTIPHDNFVIRAKEALAARSIGVVKEEYALARDGARMFGMLTLDVTRDGVSLVMGVRNSHDKSFSLGVVAGFRVFVCDNLAFSGDFQPLAKKHSKHLLRDLPDALDLAGGRIQRQFPQIMSRIDQWKSSQLSDNDAKSLIYRSFIMGELDAPERLAGIVHQHYFNPPHEEFAPRTLWSLQNAYTEAFKELAPQPQYKALASLDTIFGGIIPPAIDAEILSDQDE
jgi:hypothetical protein